MFTGLPEAATAWMKSVWLPMVPELSAANSHEVMQGRTVVLAILDRTLKDFEQTKQKIKAAALEWLDVRALEDKTEKQELREDKESKIEQAKEKGDKKAIERAKGIQVTLEPKKEVGFAWVDGVFWGRWCRGTSSLAISTRLMRSNRDAAVFAFMAPFVWKMPGCGWTSFSALREWRRAPDPT